MTAENLSQDAASLVGKALGQYEIISVLGQGGMATVYKAYQASLDRYIALKVLLPHFAEPEFVARFKREALAAARLSHPNVVHIYDAGEVSGLYYIAMEYIEGGTLKDRLDERNHEPLDAPTINMVVQGIGSALQFADKNGIVHRDIKPANIMFTGDGRVVLADLGLAKFYEAADLTQMTAVIGTPFYMSPEQARSQAVDARSDIYSFGVVIYEMLTGHVPFEADTPWMAIHQHIYESPPPIRQANPVVSDGVAKVVEKALAKAPEDRYQQADDLVQAFLNAQKKPALASSSSVPMDAAPTSVSAIPVARQQVMATLRRDNRRSATRFPVVLLVAAALVVVVMVAAVAFWAIGQLSGFGPASAERITGGTPTMTLAPATESVQPAVITVTLPSLTPTETAAPPTATDTALPTNTYTAVPPSATATFSPVPPTNSPANTSTPTATPTHEKEPSPTGTRTATPTRAAPTSTWTPSLTPTVAPKDTNTPAPTETETAKPPEPTATDTPKPPDPTATNTPKPPDPTATDTPVPPTSTDTPVPPTSTDTPVVVPSDTPTPKR